MQVKFCFNSCLELHLKFLMSKPPLRLLLATFLLPSLMDLDWDTNPSYQLTCSCARKDQRKDKDNLPVSLKKQLQYCWQVVIIDITAGTWGDIESGVVVSNGRYHFPTAHLERWLFYIWGFNSTPVSLLVTTCSRATCSSQALCQGALREVVQESLLVLQGLWHQQN